MGRGTQTIMSNYQPPSAGPNQGQEQAVESSASTGTSLFGQAKTMKQKVMKNVRWVTALTGLGLCVAAVFSFSLSGIILCVYLCPIGIIITITETEKMFYGRVIEYFPLLTSHTGRGIAYVLVAGLTLSVGTLACYIVGFVLLAEGLVSIFYHFLKDKTEGDEGAQDTQLDSIESGNAPANTTQGTPFNNAPAKALAGPAYTPSNDSFAGQKRDVEPAPPKAEAGSRSLSEIDPSYSGGNGAML